MPPEMGGFSPRGTQRVGRAANQVERFDRLRGNGTGPAPARQLPRQRVDHLEGAGVDDLGVVELRERLGDPPQCSAERPVLQPFPDGPADHRVACHFPERGAELPAGAVGGIAAR